MICCKCFELMLGTEAGTLRIITSKERAYILIHRGAEIIHFIQAAAIAAEADKNEAN